MNHKKRRRSIFWVCVQKRAAGERKPRGSHMFLGTCTQSRTRRHGTKVTRFPLVSTAPNEVSERPRTTIRISHFIIGHVDGASVQLALWLNVGRNGTRDTRPHRLACGIGRQQRRRLPYRWKIMDVRDNWSIGIPCALEVEI
jgi:hypothetical protein